MTLETVTVLFTLGVLGVAQHEATTQGTYTVTLEETSCLSTRRVRCSYRFVDASPETAGPDRRRFDLVFYIGADLAEGGVDAISRLDRLFSVERKVSMNPYAAHERVVRYTRPVSLRIQGSRYEFRRDDGETTVVDSEKRTRP